MALEAGQKLGPYEIIAPIGAGGMGEVYKAKDTRLDRTVAIKVLPSHVASNPEVRQRFEREARAVSSLNHPHICTLYDIGSENGIDFMVMEHIEGETLADRLKKGAMPFDQALRCGMEVADALDKAHRQGVVHRDLKPGNIMLTKSGSKLLDFGLAKLQAPGSGLDLSGLPTEQKSLTEKGSILGTFQYMAPEQLEGKEVDARTDIFAFGVVLYEMLTGRKAFEGGSHASLIGAILKDDPPPISTLEPMTPAALDWALKKCLAKDPDDRWQSAHDVASELQWISEVGSRPGAGEVARGKRVRGSHVFAASLLVVGVLLGAIVTKLAPWKTDQSAGGLPLLRYIIEHGDLRDSRPAISPDGTRVAYAAHGSLWIRDLSQLAPLQIAGTEGGSVPTWSPDGEWLAFSVDGELWKIRVDGSGKIRLCSPAPSSDAGGAVWLPDGRIVFETGSSGLYEVSDRGGDPRIILEPKESEADFHFVSALPGGKGFLFVPHEGDTFDSISLWDGTERKTLLRLAGQLIGSPVYAPSGHLLFDRFPKGRGIWAVAFSLATLEVTGEPFPVEPLGAQTSLALNGTLVYVPVLPTVLSEIVIVDRFGRDVRTIGSPRPGIYPQPALSPDGRRLVVPIAGTSGFDLWLYDLTGGGPRRITFEDSPQTDSPAWTPDGDEVVFTWSSATNDISLRAIEVEAGGALRDIGKGAGPVAFTADGETMLYTLWSEGFNMNLWRKAVDEDGPGEPLLADEGQELNPAISPDGRWLAYDHGGAVLIRSYPQMGRPLQVASGNAAGPRWNPRGDRLFYLSGNDLMEVEIATSPSIHIGAAQKLFAFQQVPALPASSPLFAVGPEDETFIMVRPLEPIPGLVVVQNWLGAVR